MFGEPDHVTKNRPLIGRLIEVVTLICLLYFTQVLQMTKSWSSRYSISTAYVPQLWEMLAEELTTSFPATYHCYDPGVLTGLRLNLLHPQRRWVKLMPDQVSERLKISAMHLGNECV